jgi:predicted lipoprotein with Yx(FWY)xxD motif
MRTFQEGQRMGTRLVARVVALALVAGVGVGAAFAATMTKNGTVQAAHNRKYGSLLVTSSGLSLYHMTAERRGSIKCTGACARLWPPLIVSGGSRPTAGAGASASKLGTIKRPDGRIQVTYNKMALYRYSLDTKAGNVKGQGVEGIWFAVTPAGKLATAGGTATTTTTSDTTTSDTTTTIGYG